MLKGKNVLVTGGTGSFGHAFVQRALAEEVGRIVVYSRDEYKQFLMQSNPVFNDRRMRFFLGDVRDRERLARALVDIDIVIHAAALKQVPAAEYNPFEAIKTNVIGAENLISCAIDRGVERVIALSTDKAANPVNLYGATKLCSDKLFVAGNVYSGDHNTRFAVVRYGNVVGSRGSVVPLFLEKREQRFLPITDTRMTRFWITLQEAVSFTISSLGLMQGGEIFIPKIPSMHITDLARVIAPQAEFKVVGLRPGEKLHEVLVTENDAGNTIEFPDRYVCLPSFAVHDRNKSLEAWRREGSPCAEGFHYSSDNNTEWLTDGRLAEMVEALDLPAAKRWAAERERTISDVAPGHVSAGRG